MYDFASAEPIKQKQVYCFQKNHEKDAETSFSGNYYKTISLINRSCPYSVNYEPDLLMDGNEAALSFHSQKRWTVL